MPNKAEQRALNESIETYRSYRDAHADALETTEECMNMVLGDQWSEADKKALNKKKLPYLTKNLILPIMNRVSGMEIMNQTDMVVQPTEGGLDEIAWAMTRLNYYFKNRPGSDLNFLLGKAFLIGLIGNMGAYLRPYYTTMDDPLGDCKYNLISGMNILPDPMFKEYDLNDSKRVCYTCWWTKEDGMLRYPGKKKDIENLQQYRSNFFGGLFQRKAGRMTDLISLTDRTERGGRYRVIEMWEKKEKRERFLYDPFTEEKFKPKSVRETTELLFYHPDVIERELKKTEMHVTVTMSDNIVLYSGLAPIQNGKYPFIPFFPYFIDGDIIGMVHNLRDYQKEHNKRSSSILHILMATANSGWLTRKGSTDAEILERDGSGLGPIIEYTGEKPEKITPNTLPTGLVYTDNEARAGLYETSGIGPNLQGRAENSRESGKLFEKRVDEGNIMLQPIFENYAKTKRNIGEYQIWLYQNVLTPERIYSILEEEYMPNREPINRELANEIANNMKVGKYNVTVENVAKASSARQKMQGQVENMLKAMPPELVPWHEVVRITDLEPEMKEKWAKFIEQRMGVGQDIMDAAQMLQATQGNQQPTQ